jgi:predicted dehydrogenase
VTQQSPLRVGVIGASVSGGWALESHLPALKRLPGISLQSVATSRQSTADETAHRFGAVRAFSSAHDLVADPDVDLVTVAVRVPAHHEVVVAAIEAGKDVYCEWPLDVGTEPARRLRDLGEDRGVSTVVGLQARVSPTLLAARDLVAEGYAGRVLSVRLFSAGLGLGGPVLPADREWAADRANGLSALTVRCAHTLDAMEVCVGPLAELSSEVVIATPRPRLAGTDRVVRKTAPDQVLVTGRLAGGATVSGQFLLGVRPPQTPLITVMGTEGTLSVLPDVPDGQIQMSAMTLVGGRGAETAKQLPVPVRYRRVPDDVPAGSAAAVAHLYAAVRDRRAGGDVAVPDFATGVRLHELLDTVERAARTGVRQAVARAVSNS